MKKFFIALLILIFSSSFVFAGSINPALYNATRLNSSRYYRNNRIKYRPTPYWQAQANYATRNRTYQNYSNYNYQQYRQYSSPNINRGLR